MSTVRRHALLVLAPAIAALLLAGCGSDSSGPKPLTAAQDAAHYDSLAGALLAAGTHGDSVQAAGVEIISGVVADGQTPSKVTVTINGTTATWFGNFANLVDSAANDSIQVVSLWSDVNVDKYVVLELFNNQFIQAQSIASGGDLGEDSTATVLLTPAAAAGTCSITQLVNVNSPDIELIYTYDPSNSSCQPESASTSATMTFRADTTTGSIHSLSLSAQTTNGVRLQTTAGNSFPSRITPPPIGARLRR
jgi:hypothetical protein